MVLWMKICGPEEDIVMLAKTGYELRDKCPTLDNKNLKSLNSIVSQISGLLNFQCFECDGV
jgi:hypothetical protein